MAYILLLLGILIGGYAFYRFLLKATPKEIGTLIVVIGTLAITAAIFLLAVSGRLPGAVGAVAAMWPLLYSVWRSHKQVQAEEKIFETLSKTSRQMSQDEALDVLGLNSGSSESDIIDAHRRLIKKLHPDRDGTEWMAQKINEARDVLLKAFRTA